MGHDDAGQFEWVNAWAEAQRPNAADPPPVLQATVAHVAAKPAAAVLQRTKPAAPPEQLIRDIVEITRVRDALAAAPMRPVFAKQQRTQATVLVPARTTDAVPVLIGGVMALVLLTVFGAAAAMTKFAR
jgi:hypothetical protein